MGRLSGRFEEAVWSVRGGCLKGGGRLSGRFGRLSVGYGEVVCLVWGGCLEGVGRLHV